MFNYPKKRKKKKNCLKKERKISENEKLSNPFTAVFYNFYTQPKTGVNPMIITRLVTQPLVSGQRKCR